MATPRPGTKARGSSSGRPVMVLLDLLGRRWTMRVLWELRAGPMTFRTLQSATEGVSPSADRLSRSQERPDRLP